MRRALPRPPLQTMGTSAKRFFALAVIAIAVVVFGATLISALYLSPANEVTVSADPAIPLPPSEDPERLQIPAIGVDAHIQDVGLGKTGNMAVPTNYTDVGWYRRGTVPGQLGSAVIDGHVDNGFGLAAVFKHLSDIKVGDDIYIVTKQGTRIHFKVQEIGNYGVSDVPLDRLFNRTDAARLNLITCEGTWIPSKKMYDERMVIYTVLAA